MGLLNILKATGGGIAKAAPQLRKGLAGLAAAMGKPQGLAALQAEEEMGLRDKALARQEEMDVLAKESHTQNIGLGKLNAEAAAERLKDLKKTPAEKLAEASAAQTAAEEIKSQYDPPVYEADAVDPTLAKAFKYGPKGREPYMEAETDANVISRLPFDISKGGSGSMLPRQQATKRLVPKGPRYSIAHGAKSEPIGVMDSVTQSLIPAGAGMSPEAKAVFDPYRSQYDTMLQRDKDEADKRANDVASRFEQGQTRQSEANLRQDYRRALNDLKIPQAMAAMRGADSMIKNASTNPIAGVGLVYVLIKALDAGSAVKEGEVRLVKDAQSYPGGVETWWKQRVLGSGMAQSLVKQMANAVRDLQRDTMAQKANVDKEYEARATDLGVRTPTGFFGREQAPQNNEGKKPAKFDSKLNKWVDAATGVPIQ